MNAGHDKVDDIAHANANHVGQYVMIRRACRI
jgi:hypothetical protein